MSQKKTGGFWRRWMCVAEVSSKQASILGCEKWTFWLLAFRGNLGLSPLPVTVANEGL